MKNLQIVKGMELHQVAFKGGKGALPLSARTPEQLLELAIIGRRSNDPAITGLFEDLPTLEELLAMKAQPLISQVAATSTSGTKPGATETK